MAVLEHTVGPLGVMMAVLELTEGMEGGRRLMIEHTLGGMRNGSVSTFSGKEEVMIAVSKGIAE